MPHTTRTRVKVLDYIVSAAPAVLCARPRHKDKESVKENKDTESVKDQSARITARTRKLKTGVGEGNATWAVGMRMRRVLKQAQRCHCERVRGWA